MNNAEEWRAVKGFEGIYEVSNRGRVRSLDREDSAGRQRSGVVLSGYIDKRKGYCRVGLCKNAVPSMHLVHILVATAFLGECPEGFEVAHKDHCGSNNYVENLEYVTHAENMRQSAALARLGHLSIDEVQDIREILTENPRASISEIADILSVSRELVYGVARATLYKHVPNRDGTLPRPINIRTFLTLEDVTSMLELGFTLPEIGRYYAVEYSTPYQVLRRAKRKTETTNSLFLE